MRYSTVVSALVVTAVVACSSDPTSTGDDELVGQWQKAESDCYDRASTLVFSANREGKLTEASCDAFPESACPSGDENWFEWSVVDDKVFLEHYRRVICGREYPSRTIAGSRYGIRSDTLFLGAVPWTRVR